MSVVAILLIYFSGFFNGAIALFFLTVWMGKRAIDRRKVKGVKGDKGESINLRMKRVKEITSEMLELAMKTEVPQKNSLDGKHKNSLSAKINALDEEKNDILKSIIKDGYDPELTTMDSAGVISKMKLSEYMAYMGITMEPSKKSSNELKAERLNRFTIFKGGKGDDDGGMTH